MLGAHHAGTGAAVWVAATAANPIIPALGLAPLAPEQVAIGGLVAAGAALLPDADHPSATIAYSFPGAKLVTGAVGAAAGGHRHGTHSLVAAIGVVILAWWLTAFSGWVNAEHLSTYVVACGAVAVATFAWATKVLKIVRSWLMAWVTGLALSAFVTLVVPSVWAALPAAIATGWVVHLAGDILTTGGLPLTWPFSVKPPKAWTNLPILSNVWTRGGYFALPILGNTGSWRELALATPLTLYAMYGMAVSALAILPFFPFR